MAKKKAATEAPEAAAAPAEQISKADAIRAALADGVDQPAKGVAYVKEKFGLEITNQAFSTGKFQESKKKGGGKKLKGGISQVGIKSAARVTANTVGNGKAADLARAVKELIAAYGADEVAAMVTVLSE